MPVKAVCFTILKFIPVKLDYYLDGVQTIALTHLAEAIQYRTYDFSVAEP